MPSLGSDLDDDDLHWLDMTTKGRGRAKKGVPSTSALKSSRRPTPMYTGKKQRVFWLGRKASLNKERKVGLTLVIQGES